MAQPVDLAKLVGAASAPVALIISTCIFVSNLTARFSGMFTSMREMTKEYRQMEEEEENDRSASLKEQIRLYRKRLRLVMRANFWLMVTIWCFIGTVAFTSVSVILPNTPLWPIITGVSMFAGLFLFAYCVVLSAQENHLAKKALFTEVSEFPEIDSDAHEGFEQQKRSGKSAVQHDSASRR